MLSEILIVDGILSAFIGLGLVSLPKALMETLLSTYDKCMYASVCWATFLKPLFAHLKCVNLVQFIFRVGVLILII